MQVNFRGQFEQKCLQDDLEPGESFGFGTNPTMPLPGLFFVGWGDAHKWGSAMVLSGQRDLHVAAFLVCRDGPHSADTPTKLLTMTQLPAIQLR